jgi:hypothetical protein
LGKTLYHGEPAIRRLFPVSDPFGPLMIETFGDDYRRYMARTSRILPVSGKPPMRGDAGE